MSKERYIKVKDLTEDFEEIADNLSIYGCSGNDALELDLSTAKKKLVVYGERFGENDEFFKQFMLISERLAITIKENKRSSIYI